MSRLSVLGRVIVGLSTLPLLVLGLPALISAAQPMVEEAPAIGLIIDDLGNEFVNGHRAVELPGPVTCAFLPHTPFAHRLAQEAHATGKEVMLHLPMQSVEDRALGPGGLTLDMSRAQFDTTLRDSLASIPHVRGVNNHMGSLLTRHPGHMEWLMSDLANRDGLYFVDSRTTSLTVAHRIAHESSLPYISRDVFLDHELADETFILAQWERLVNRARKQGFAVGIAHPYPATLDVLERMIPRLAAHGIRLVHMSELISLKERTPTWQASLSRSPKAAKN